MARDFGTEVRTHCWDEGGGEEGGRRCADGEGEGEEAREGVEECVVGLE